MAITSSVRTRVLEVFADVWCPFTHVGLHRLVEQRARLGCDDVTLRVRAWPLELVNGHPLDVGLVTEEIRALQEAVAPELFRGFDRDRFPSTTLPALALAASAYARDEGTGEQVSLDLRTALFEQDRDIADPVELTKIASAAGVDYPGPDAERLVLDDWHDGQRRGVTGSPTFFAGGHVFFCPSLAIEHVGDSLRVRFDTEGFEAFTAAVFDRAAPERTEPR